MIRFNGLYEHEKGEGFYPAWRPLEVQLGYGLIPLVQEEKRAPLLQEIGYCRENIFTDFGFYIPPIHIRDNMCLEPYEYALMFNDVKMGELKKIQPEQILCIKTNNNLEKISGIYIKEPVSGIEVVITDESNGSKAEQLGYKVCSVSNFIRVQLTEIIRKNIHKFLNQHMVNEIINRLRPQNPDVVDNVMFTHHFSVSNLKIILNWLLEEGVPIRDINTIMETISDYIDENDKPVFIMEKIRERLAYDFIPKYADEDKVVNTILVSESVGELLYQNLDIPNSGIELPDLLLEKNINRKLIQSIKECLKTVSEKNTQEIFLCPSCIRTGFSEFLKRTVGSYPCISERECLEMNREYTFKKIGELVINEK